MDVDIKLDERDYRNLQKALDHVIAMGRVSVQKALHKAAYSLLRSAAAASKLGKTKHELIPNPNLTTRFAGFPLLAVYLTQGGGRALVPVSGLSDPKTTIERRGLAKASWLFMQRRFGPASAAISKSGKEKRYVARYTYVRDSSAKRGIAQVLLVNSLGYISTAYPGIAETATRKGMTAFAATFDREFASRLKRQWA